MRRTLLCLLTLTLSIGCGGESTTEASDKTGASKSTNENPSAGGNPTPPQAAKPVDCAHFEKRVLECTDELTLRYASTEWAGGRMGDGTAEEKAGRLKKAINSMHKQEGKTICNDIADWGNLKEKGGRWLTRYHACDPNAPCDQWGQCVGDALGTPLR